MVNERVTLRNRGSVTLSMAATFSVVPSGNGTSATNGRSRPDSEPAELSRRHAKDARDGVGSSAGRIIRTNNQAFRQTLFQTRLQSRPRRAARKDHPFLSHKSWSAWGDLHSQGCSILSRTGLLFPLKPVAVKWWA